MRFTFAGRNVVMLGAIALTTRDLAELERRVGLDRAATQILQPQFTLVEYERLRLISDNEGRLQVDIHPAAPGAFVEAAAGTILDFFGASTRAVGINANLAVALEDGDLDPVKPLLALNALEGRLGNPVERAGLKLIYSDASARVSTDVVPDLDNPMTFSFAVNRHYDPPPADAGREQALTWLSEAAGRAEELATKLLGDPEVRSNAA